MARPSASSWISSGVLLLGLGALVGAYGCESDTETTASGGGDPAGSTGSSGGGGTTSASGGGGTSAASGGMGGAGGVPAPSPVEEARCGLDFDWLPTSSVGALLTDETPHSTLTVIEALVAQTVLETEGITFNRTPAYETLAHRISYTTQDRGEAREATGLVVVPQVPQAETFPVIVFHHGTTGLADVCAPSYNFEDTGSAQFAVALLLSMISSFGYIVVAPDYLGQKAVGTPSPSLHPYLVGEPTAVASWDAVRATEGLLAADASSAASGPIALWGASQGGHAAMFTAMYHSFYAPEMDLRTGVYNVPPTDLQAHITLGTRQLRSSSGNAVLLYTAYDAWYQPDLSPGLSQIFLSPIDTQAPAALATDCSPDFLDNVTNTDEVFTPELIAASLSSELTGYEPWGCFVREGTISLSSMPAPTIPGLVIYGEDDTLVLTAIERDAFDDLCTLGHQLSYLECAGAGHEEGFFYAIDDALDYIDDRLAGTAVTNTCVQSAPATCANTP